jgi:colanic acid/amylovoran biosynthesis glycosyltransferase
MPACSTANPTRPGEPIEKDSVAVDSRPLVISACGTYLKPEMRSIHRQIAGLDRVRTIVYAQKVENRALFPFDPVVKLTKLHHRTKGNFLLRFWFKYVIRQWPPPIRINKYVGPCHPYDMPERLRADAPDLVHVYYGHKAVRYLGMLKDWGGPWIVSFHGVDAAKFLEREGYLEQLREVFETAVLVLARSESLLERLADLGCPRHKLRLNRTAIPLDHLPVVKRERPADGRWRLVQACRLIPKKGILTLLRALRELAPRYPSLRYVLCGDGPQAERIRGEAAALGIAEMVEERGWLSPGQLLAEYEKGHIFVHPSELTGEADQEGVPNSMLEAMATAMPVVATRHGGIPEAVADGRDGLLVEEKNPAQLAAAIERMITGQGLWEAMGGRASATVRAHFEAKKQIRALEDCYLEAIAIARASAESARLR